LIRLAALVFALGVLPFPAPRLIQATDKTKCDWGPVASIAPNGSQIVVTTPAGPVTYKTGAEVQVVGTDGKPLGNMTVLHVGQGVRVYYVVNEGAIAQEVDLM
jgi:hypothetical protein